MAPQPHIQGRTCTGEPGARFFPKPRFALETGHLWGALVGGRHPTKPQKKQFFNLTVVGKLSCFRELYFFPKQLKIQLLPKTKICIGNEIEYQHAHILCMVFCNLFSRNGLNLYCSNHFPWISTICGGDPLR